MDVDYQSVSMQCLLICGFIGSLYTPWLFIGIHDLRTKMLSSSDVMNTHDVCRLCYQNKLMCHVIQSHLVP